MSALIIVIFTIIYIASVCGIVSVYGKKDMSVTIWALILLFLPGVNTYFAIKETLKYNSDAFRNFFSFKNFIDEFYEK